MTATPSDHPATIRTRFAPSPSGHLHVGGARTALFNWAYAEARDGRFILRIEDTDVKRSSDAAGMAFLEDLKWLGIAWDEGPEYDGCGGGDSGPYHQSKRLDLYNCEIDRLLDSGQAYRAFETPEELAARREEARQARRNYRYDRAALELDDATVQQHLEEGRPHVVRFKVPEGEVRVHDEVRGDITVSSEEMEDFVIRKADGYPTYHFAVVVDDELMGVTHVIRAQEHLKNTLKHVLLQGALGFRRPVYAHVSVITNPDGSKMSKRDKDKALRQVVQERGLDSPPNDAIPRDRWAWWLESKDNQLALDEAERLAAALSVTLPEINVDDFRRHGYLPEVLCNYLALLGWNPGENIEKFDVDFFVKRFDFDRLIRSDAKFDRDKLLNFNNEAIDALPLEEFGRRLREHAERYHPEFVERLGSGSFALFAAANQTRSKTLEDPFTSDRFFIVEDEAIEWDLGQKPVRKALSGGEPSGFDHLEAILPVLRGLPGWDVATIEQAVKAYAEEHADGKLGKVAQPLRVAVTGGPVSPAIFETLAILGRESTLTRIQRCLAQRETAAKS